MKYYVILFNSRNDILLQTYITCAFDYLSREIDNLASRYNYADSLFSVAYTLAWRTDTDCLKSYVGKFESLPY